MHKGSWSYVLAALGWLTLAAASPNQNGATAHKPEAAQSVQEAPAPIAPRAAPEPTQPTQSQEYYRPCDGTQNDSGSDLCAQWRTAKWTKIAAIFGILGFGGVLFALGLSIMSTRAAVRSNEIADETAKRELRAYLTLASEITVGGLAAGEHFEATVRVINSGQTPATQVLCSSYIRGAVLPASEETFAEAEDITHESTSILPRDGTLQAAVKTEIPIPQEVIDAITANQVGLFVFGRINYQDVFERHWVTRFRLIYLPERGTFKNCGAGNEIT